MGDDSINMGSIAENAVCECLVKAGFDAHYYRRDSGEMMMELDFVVELGEELCVIEVKSGRKKSAKSLNKALSEDKAIDIAMKVSDSNISTDENGVRHYPLFGPSFFEDRAVLELPR